MDDRLKEILAARGFSQTDKVGQEGEEEEGDTLVELVQEAIGAGEPTKTAGILEALLEARGKGSKEDPVLAPVLEKVAKKLGLSPEMAELVVGYALDKLASRRKSAKPSGKTSSRRTTKRKTTSGEPKTSARKKTTKRSDTADEDEKKTTTKRRTSKSKSESALPGRPGSAKGSSSGAKGKTSTKRRQADDDDKPVKRTTRKKTSADHEKPKKRSTTQKKTSEEPESPRKRTTTKRRTKPAADDLDLSELLERMTRAQEIDPGALPAQHAGPETEKGA